MPHDSSIRDEVEILQIAEMPERPENFFSWNYVSASDLVSVHTKTKNEKTLVHRRFQGCEDDAMNGECSLVYPIQIPTI